MKKDPSLALLNAADNLGFEARSASGDQANRPRRPALFNK